MPQLFGPSANLIARASILGLVALVIGVAAAGGILYRSAYSTGAGMAVRQPVPFSHQHHVGALGIDCRYCHTSATTSSFAGMPPTDTCMNCHSKVWTEAEMLEPVRASWRSGIPLRWRRVYNLPDFVFFDHSIHVAKGVGCVTCHGRVDRMPLLAKAQPLFMEWCLECHRRPERYIRPREEVFNMDWHAADQEALGRRLLVEYDIRDASVITDCTTCHR